MTPSERPLLEVSDLHVSYGSVRALNGVDLVVCRGEIVAVLGANGSGKSTLMKTIAGLLKPRAGTILYDGDPHRARPDVLLKRGLSLVLQGRRVFPEHSVSDNLLLGAFSLPRAAARERRAAIYEQFPLLAEMKSEPAGTLSGGQQQILCFGRALMTEPRLLILDEPSIGLDPINIEAVFSAVRAARDGGATILLVEQRVGTALAVADRAYVLQTGRVVVAGTPDELRSNPALSRAYLGI